MRTSKIMEKVVFGLNRRKTVIVGVRTDGVVEAVNVGKQALS